ncbi:hypothetical protein [Methanobrevibacter sp.]|uniref:hypothetical protein n=1 Tax=Methanobrevibacter sp. TaxID=66852 RepID=UPI0038635E6C
MNEVDFLQYELKQKEKAYDKLHKKYISLLKENEHLKIEFENAMIDYQILIEKNPLDNYYKIANRALSELYVDLFGDEAYGHYLANYHSRMKERK